MTRVVVDGSSTAQAATHNQYIAGDTGLGQTLLAYRIYYDGAAWQCDTKGSVSTSADVEAGLSWDATDDELDVDLSSLTGSRIFDLAGVPVVTPYASAGASPKTMPFIPACRSSSATDYHISWYNSSGTHQTTEDTKMDCCFMILGTESS
jgi:hypothetical protein